MASQLTSAGAHVGSLQPAVVSFQSAWPCFPLTLPVNLLPRLHYATWDCTGLAEPSWGSHAPFNLVTDAWPGPKKSRKFFLDRSVFDLVDAHPYLSLTDPKLLGWYLGLTPKDRNIILDEGGFHQFLQRHPALELSKHHVYVKYPNAKISPVLPALTSMSQESEASGSKKSKYDVPHTRLKLDMCRGKVRETLNLQQHQVIRHCTELVHLQDNFHKEPSQQRVLTERLLQANEDKPPWQMSSSVAVCKEAAALANVSLDMELEQCRQRRRGHILENQKANVTASLAEVSPLQSERPNSRESSTVYFDSTDVDDQTVVQSVKPEQDKRPSEEKGGRRQDLTPCGKAEPVDEDEDGTNEDDNIQSILEDEESVLMYPDSTWMKKLLTGPAAAKTEGGVEASKSMKPQVSKKSVSTCDAVVGTTPTPVTTAFTQSENPLTEDKNVQTELYMSDLDEITEEFIKMKMALEEREKMKSSGDLALRKECECIGRAQRAELHLLSLQYSMCTQHCWRLYYTSAEGGLTSIQGDPTKLWLKEPPVSLVGVLEKLEADYNWMRHKILDGVPLQQLKPLCVDSEKISSGASYTPAQMTGDVMGNLPSWRPLKTQEKESSDDRECTANLEFQTEEEEEVKSKRRDPLVLKDGGADQGAACKELNTSEAWFDAEEVLDHVGPAETEPDPALNVKDGTTGSAAVEGVSNSHSILCVTNLPDHVTESDVTLWFDKYGASEVNISVLKNGFQVAMVTVSGLQAAEAAVREMNGFGVDGCHLRVELIGGDAAAAAASAKSSQEDTSRPQTLRPEPSGSGRELLSPPPVSSGVKRRTVVSVTPTSKGTFVPQHFGTMGSFDYLMSELTRRHPHMEKQRFVDALVELRAKHRGVLCGLPLSRIRDMASELLTGSQADAQM